MFYADLNISANFFSADAPTLTKGLSILTQDETLDSPRAARLNASGDALLDNWETERLQPSSTTLRSVVLVKNGKPVPGAVSLAQKCASLPIGM